MSQPTGQKPPAIACPFLAIVEPETSRAGAFARDCHRHGMGRWMARFVTRQVTWKQQGLIAALLGRAPDIKRLDEVPGISHLDLYTAFPTEVRSQLSTRGVDGIVNLQDLVEIKESIAELAGVEIIDSSRIETALLFLMAGGDLGSGTVATADVRRLLDGEAIASGATVTAAKLSRARKASEWTN